MLEQEIRNPEWRRVRLGQMNNSGTSSEAPEGLDIVAIMIQLSRLSEREELLVDFRRLRWYVLC